MMRAPRSWARCKASTTASGTGRSRGIAGTATRSASSTRSRPWWTSRSKPIDVLTRPGRSVATANSVYGTPCSRRSTPQASHRTPSSKGATPSKTTAATLVNMVPPGTDSGWQDIDYTWRLCHWWQYIAWTRITAMSLLIAFTLILGLAVMIAVVAELNRAIRGDGYGYRPTPRSLADDHETRSQTLGRVAH